MPKLYSTELRVYVTAYIVADSEEEAEATARNMAGIGLELPTGYAGDGIEVYGRSYHPDMPRDSLSPAVTIAPFEEQNISLDLVEDFGDEGEEG